MRLPNAALVREFRKIKRSELPGCNCLIPCPLEVDHEPTWGSHHQETSLTLSRISKCWHDKKHNDVAGWLIRKKIQALICRREGCSAEDRQMVIDLIWRAPKGATREWFMAEAASCSFEATELLLKTLMEAGI